MSSKQRAAIGREVRDMLGESAPIEFQDSITQELMATGESRGKTNARVISERVFEMARAGDKWAIDFIAERAEGKAAPATNADDAVRLVEEALSDVTVQHLNQLAGLDAQAPVGANPLAESAGGGGDGHQDRAGHRPAGPVSPLLDVPEDGDRGPEDF